MSHKLLKIAYIIPSLAPGGAERFILDLIANLDREKFSPTLICFAGGGFFEEEAKKLNCDLVILKKYFKFDPLNFFKLYQTIEKIKPDIVHTQLGGDFYGRLVAKLLGVPVIISNEQNVNTDEGKFQNRLKKMSVFWADKVVGISQAVLDDMKKRYGVPEEKAQVIYNGLEIKRFLNEEDNNDSEATHINREVIFGSVGRLVPQKNYSLLIDAISNINRKDFKCLIAGEGELRGALEKQIKDLKLEDRVKLLGNIRDVKMFFKDLDFFVLPSLWEGLGVVLLEAGMYGLPILASNTDGIREVIKNGETGILFNNNDLEDLSNKLEGMIRSVSDPEFKLLGENLKQSVLERFDIKKIAGQYQDLYQNLIKQKLSYENTSSK